LCRGLFFRGSALCRGLLGFCLRVKETEELQDSSDFERVANALVHHYHGERAAIFIVADIGAD